MRRILLIVDDVPEIGRSLGRFFRSDFETVLIATNPEEAERLLGDPHSPPTHLICDHFLGEAGALGADLVPGWRRKFSSLQVAVLLTGSELGALNAGNGIDAVFSKPIDALLLRRYLLTRENATLTPQ